MVIKVNFLQKRPLIIILIISLLGLLLLLNIPVFSMKIAEKVSPSVSTLFIQANTNYEKGQFEEAIPLYQKIEADGYESGNLYYNLGNSFFKLGKNGWAILYYEKAKRLIPQDSDLKTNLALALTKVNEGEVNWRDEFFRNLVFLAPINLLALISSGCFLLIIIWLCIAIIFPSKVRSETKGHLHPWWVLILIFCCILFVSALSITTLTYLDRKAEQAVSIKSGAQARFEPNSTATISYSLAEGSRVFIHETKGEWCLISRRDRKRGWVEKNYLERI